MQDPGGKQSKKALFSHTYRHNIRRRYRVINDADIIQQDLEKLYTWQESNNTKFNSTKFQVLQFGNDKCKNDYNYFSPNMENPVIPTDYTKDLGVYIDDRLNY